MSKNESVTLNKLCPEGRNKAKTYVMDFHGLESTDKPLNDFERECLSSITFDPTGEMRLLIDISVMVDKFPRTEKIILQKKREGWTDKEIADFLYVARRTVIRKLDLLFKKFSKVLK